MALSITALLLIVISLASGLEEQRNEFDFECDDDYVLIAGKCYKFNQEAVSWSTAENLCKKDGAELASVKTQEQYTELLRHINANYGGRYWLSGALVGSRWLWTADNSPMKSQWFGRTPSQTGSKCAYFCSFTNKYWDAECSLHKRYICEKRSVDRFAVGDEEVDVSQPLNF